MQFSKFLPFALMALATLAHAQDPDDPDFGQGRAARNLMSKEEQKQKFHMPDVRGMDAATRMKGYQQRLQMEAMSPFSQIKWRNVGPEIQGGRVVEIQSVKKHPEIIYCAYASGGLWRTADDGYHWVPVFDNESAFAIGSFALSEDGNTIWIGTGENNGQRTSYSGTGVFKSTDAGKTWSNVGLQDSHRVASLLIDPKNENTVYVAAQGHLYSQNDERGVYKTTDGGKTWSKILYVDKYTGMADMVMDPRNPEVLYASTWQRDRRAWDFVEGGPGTAVYRTTNGGKSWQKLAGGFPEPGNLGRIGLAIAPSKPNRVYAFIDNQGIDPDSDYADEYQPSGILTPNRLKMVKEDVFVTIDKAVLTKFFNTYMPSDMKVDDTIKAVQDKKMTMKDIQAAMIRRNPNIFPDVQANAQCFRSDDGGKTWINPHRGNLGFQGSYYDGRVSVNPSNPDDVTITGTLMLRSHDGGKTWEQVCQNVHVDFHWYWFDPTNPKFQATGCDGGIYFSKDDGQNWVHIINDMAVGQFTTIAVDNKVPYNIYGGLQDNGTMRGPSTYRPGRNDPSSWKDIGGGDGSWVAVDPRNDGDVVYVGSQFGAQNALNQKTSERWNVRPRAERGDPPLRFNWVTPCVISPHHSDIIYMGAQKLFRSLDQGRTWEAISGDLTKNKPNGNVPFSTIKDISESPLKFGLIYVGCDDGTVKVTKDHGNTWTDISTPQPDKWVMRVLASKFDRATVYCAQNGYRDDDFNPYLWKSTDYGKTWKSIAGNLPTECINVVREDPKHSDMLYVGTDLGVFVTYDGGTNWIPLVGGIPRTPVHDLVIQPRDEDIVIGTHARSVFVLKMKYLYELPDMLGKDLFLYSVDDMTRDRWEYQRKQEWDSSAPRVPQVQGTFYTKEPGKGTVRIKDKDGKIVKEQPVEAARGFNFFTLNLELAKGAPYGTVDPHKREIKTAADALKDPFEVERYKYVPEGKYKIEIEVNGKTQSVDWELGA